MRAFAVICLLVVATVSTKAQAPEITMPMRATPTPAPLPVPTPPPRPTPPPPPEQRRFPDLEAAQAAFDKAESQAAIPSLTRYIRDLDALKRQFMLRDSLQDAKAADLEISTARQHLKNAQDVVAGTRKPIADRMTQFLWGTDDESKVPHERLLQFIETEPNVSRKILFRDDNTLLRTDNVEGTWWMESGNLVLVFALEGGLQKVVFINRDVSKSVARGKFVDGPSNDQQVELIDGELKITTH